MDKEGQGKDKVHNFVDALQITLFIAIFVFIYFLTSPQAQPCFHHWLTVTLWSAWRVGRRPDNSSAAVLCFDDVFCCFPISAFSICLQSRIFARKYEKLHCVIVKAGVFVSFRLALLLQKTHFAAIEEKERIKKYLYNISPMGNAKCGLIKICTKFALNYNNKMNPNSFLEFSI